MSTALVTRDSRDHHRPGVARRHRPMPRLRAAGRRRVAHHHPQHRRPRRAREVRLPGRPPLLHAGRGPPVSLQFPAPHTAFLRVGAVSGIVGVVAALVQSAINPSYSDDPASAIEQASLSHALTLSRVLDMTAFLLLLIGISVVTTVFRVGRGAEWARLARTLFAVSAAAGAIATMVVGSFPDIADVVGRRASRGPARVRRGVRRARPRQWWHLRGLLGGARPLRGGVRRGPVAQ